MSGTRKHYVITCNHYYVNSVFPGLLFHCGCLSPVTTMVTSLSMSFLLPSHLPFIFRNIHSKLRKKDKLFNKSSSSGRGKFLSYLERLLSFSSIGVFYVFLWAVNSFWNCKKSCKALVLHQNDFRCIQFACWKSSFQKHKAISWGK